jgi:2-succinyl-6-hydroxy-2,4-cyclohexadiene-1-carboxylate synthase
VTDSFLHFENFSKSSAPIVLLHGFLGATTDWQHIVTALEHEHEFDFLAIDLPGHGDSKSIGLNYDFDQTAKAIIDILDASGISKCPMLGYSMGGRLALYTAIHYPDRFSQLFLESSTPGIEDADDREKRRQLEQRTSLKLKSMPISQFIAEWYKMKLFESISSHSRFAEMVKRRIQNDPHALSQILKNMGSGVMPSLWHELSALDMPIHVIFGEKDEKYKNMAKGMQQRGKNVTLHEIKNSGHNTHVENPAAFCRIIVENIKR